MFGKENGRVDEDVKWFDLLQKFWLFDSEMINLKVVILYSLCVLMRYFSY